MLQILAVSIENFRGIRSAEVRFNGHALLVGPNNAAKTTVLEALDLALGPDRARGPDAIDEHDFFRGSYYDLQLTPEDEERTEDVQEDPEHPEIQVLVVLGHLSPEARIRFRDHLEPWDHDEFRPLEPDEVEERDLAGADFVLRVGFRGWYDPEEDDFDTESFFLSPENPTGERARLGRRSKQAIGFLYLRSIRTARRAATMERGSLLETLLREKTTGTQLWEALLQGLGSTAQVLEGNEQVRSALDDIQSSITELVPLSTEDIGSGLRVSRLTRRHLRDTLTYFLASRESRHLLPFDKLGSGTSNVLVFALLAAIAKAKPNAIFAMEEPEISLAPHTQRAIVDRLRRTASQAIVTSHSPYVAELFLPDDLLVVRRDSEGVVTSATASAGDKIKEKALRNDFRTRFAEGMLARSVILVEGVTELWALPAAVEVLASADGTTFHSFDLDGAVFIPAQGSGEIPAVAQYFKRLGIAAHAFCDELEEEEAQAVEEAVDSMYSIPFASLEALMAAELPIGTLRGLVRACEDWSRYPRHLAPLADAASDDEWRERCREILELRKADGWAGRFLSGCAPGELPRSVVAGIARLRMAIDQPLLPATDPLAEIFRAAAPETVAEPEEEEEDVKGDDQAVRDETAETPEDTKSGTDERSP